ncbi:MAG: bifunctional alpha,alpha-trehalose-phosphate synthase (UDP-forming)/trehalose-phosphatase [Deltaproteobacteria bacterium]|nr:bifunctional alpha,alpha-trehalose-phosphate synthase (UDP-forming)/trehalose-phosphatase [Deltaproteobacteria bacterium]
MDWLCFPDFDSPAIFSRLLDTDKGGKLRITRSGGGLATRLDSLSTRGERHWLGWPGLYAEEARKRRNIRARLKKKLLHPVFLNPDHIQKFYEGYCNSTLWPLCHYFFSYINQDEKYWKAYREVNELFCRETLKIVQPGDMIWIHDYHLMLLPALIRNQLPDARIGYFHHIPFPSYELFRYLPERAELLHGLLGADLIGFHTPDYMRHFISTLYRVLQLECRVDEVQLEDRVARIDAFPMGINYDLYHHATNPPEMRSFAQELQQLAGDSKVILSVDRLDYSKGILLRLESFAAFLEHHPEYRGKVTLLMVVMPSRDGVDSYADLKTKIDTTIGAVNGAYSMVGWTPVRYFYRSFSSDELSAMYNIADIALVTPLRDGMNLVAKEYVAAKRDRPGSLILSEMTGAAVELADAIIVNPMDTRQIEEAILKALVTPDEEQLALIRKMQKSIARQTVSRWAGDFTAALLEVTQRNTELAEKHLKTNTLRQILRDYANAKQRLLLLDYDGTLVAYETDPAMARPTPPLIATLQALATDERNTVVVCSGRDKATLDNWLGDLNIGLAAEHGVFFKEHGTWQGRMPDIVWNDEIRAILEHIRDKTPRSVIEEKKTALVWHYRRVDHWLAELRAIQLVNALIGPCARLGLQIMRGDKIIEIKPTEYHKGIEARRRLEQADYDFILAIGDDTTDEDMFTALPPEAVTIKIGRFSDTAKYLLPAQSRVMPFLQALLTAQAD